MARPSFRDQFDAATLKVMAATSKEVKARVMGFVSAVVDDTPVLTGKLKGSWQIIKTGQTFLDDLPLDPTGVVTKQRLMQKIKYLPIHMDWQIYFGTPVPWAHRIEYEGWSQQAPGGMVRKNIILGGERFKGIYLGQF
jgi:hypothetical protein